jgi:autotransporter-associated beta strand protein/autotransporter passenger strand-loop-strand repeat protein
LQVVEPGGTASDTTIDGGGTVAVNGAGTLGGAVVDNGMLIFNLTGTDTFSGTLTGSGSLAVEGSGTLVMTGGDAFTGGVTISGGTLELVSGGAVGTGPITFATTNSAVLKIDGTAMPTNVISGFVSGDTIDLAGVAFDQSGGATIFQTGNVLSVVENGTSYNLQLDPSQSFSGEFVLSPDSGDGTDLTILPNSPGSTQQVSGYAPVSGYSTAPYPYAFARLSFPGLPLAWSLLAPGS